MKRRELITLIGGAAATWPFATRAQEPDRLRRIAVLMAYSESDATFQANMAVFREGLQKLGWTEGHNVRVDIRWSVDLDRLRAHAAELVALTPDVIFASASAALAPVQRATQTIPIVFANILDPVANGFVTNLARPGGNITGFAQNEQTIIAKRLELLTQIAPGVTRVAFVYDPVNPNWAGSLSQLKTTASSFGVQVSEAAVHSRAEIEKAIREFAREPNGGLVLQAGGIIVSDRKYVAALTAQHSLPAVYSFRYYVTDGGLASYGIDPSELFRGAASYVDRILKGEKPSELPVQFSTKFELIINLKTAKALGLDVPVSLLARTDEVIE